MRLSARSNLYYCGATNLSDKERAEYDLYATEPKAVEALLQNEKFNTDVLECCAGLNHITNVLKKHGYNVVASDIVDRKIGIIERDVFDIKEWSGDIVTNPPYKLAVPILKHLLNIVKDGQKIALMLRLLFLESKHRY